MAPFDRSHTSSYWHSIVIMALSCIISEIKRDKSLFFHTPAFPSPSKYCIMFGTERLELYGYPIMKQFEDMITRSHTIHECDGQQDRQTGGHCTTA